MIIEVRCAEYPVAHPCHFRPISTSLFLIAIRLFVLKRLLLSPPPIGGIARP